MNPHAKEFVPAHILRQRQQEEAKQLGDLTNQLDKVDLNKGESSAPEAPNCNDKSRNKSTGDNNTTVSPQNDCVTDNKSPTSTSNHEPNVRAQKCPTSNDEAPSKGNSIESSKQRQVNGDSNQPNSNNGIPEDCSQYGDECSDLADEDYYPFLNEGEHICEFNGEQFIIPGE